MSVTIGQLGLNQTRISRVFGSSGRLLVEDDLVAGATLLIPSDPPVLESGDQSYGDIRTVKENDGMVVNARVSAEGKISVQSDGRPYLGTEPEFALPGVEWVPEAVDAMVTYPSVSDRVLRYRFTLIGCRSAMFSAYSDGVRVKAPEA